MAQTKSSLQADGGLKAGASGTLLTQVTKGTLSIDPASLAADTEADTTVALSGAAVGDVIIVNPPATAFSAGMLMCQAHVSAAGIVTIRFSNRSAGAIDIAESSFPYILIKS